MRKVASYRTSTAPIDLAVSGTRIAIADLMKSVSVIEYNSATNTLTELARHFQTAWATAVALVDENTYLEADAEGNLMVLSQDVTSEMKEDRRRLRITSEMLLGEMVNRIRPIVNSKPSSDGTALVTPRAFLATVEGSIYLFATIAAAMQNLLMELQRAIAKYVQSPGDVPFMKYRAFRSTVREEEEPMRFVDGELVERFLDMSESVQEDIVKEMQVGGMEGKLDVEELKGMVERLRRLR